MAIEAVDVSIRYDARTPHQRLADALRYSDRQMEAFRTRRVQFIQKFAGYYYGNNVEIHDPLNMVHSLVSSLLPSVVLDPHVMVEPEDKDLWDFAGLFGAECNHRMEEMRLGKTVRRFVTEAFFGMGVAKIGLTASDVASGGAVEPPDWREDWGKCFAGVVDLDDYIPDMCARVEEGMQFEANRFRVPFDMAYESGQFDKARLEDAFGRQSEIRKHDRARDVSHEGSAFGRDRYLEEIELVEVWLPGENKIVVVDSDFGGDDAIGYLHETNWEGPEGGPFVRLGFSAVPQNIMPVPPIATVFDLFVYMNRLARKQKNRAENEKNIVLHTRGSADKDAEAIRTANDGDHIAVSSVHEVKEMQIGGATDVGYKMLAWMQDQANRMSGNPALIGGLEAESGTLGQDQMLMQQASGQIGDWRRLVYDATSEIAQQIAWYTWQDGGTDHKLSYVVQGLGKVSESWRGDEREGDWLEYNVKIDVSHKAYREPKERYQETVKWLTEVVLPMQQSGQLQGKALDVDKVVELTGEYIGVNVQGLFIDVEPEQDIGGAGSAPSGGAAGSGDQTTINMGTARPKGTPQFNKELETASAATEV